MNQNICYNCGGEIYEKNGRLICRHCGMYMPREENTTEETALLYAAFQHLRQSNFFEAEQDFEDIVNRYTANAMGYWGRLLARFGIKYEEDYDGTKIPTCYAASIESVYNSSDYNKAMEYADEETRAVFRKHADYIERVRREWVEKARKEAPYDIFISYKESDPEHNVKRTEDSFTMQELYFQLQSRGYRVFFSHESLRDKTGEKYEPYIFNALSTAKVMIVYGTKPEYINATWVKNEWTRYIKYMKDGQKKQGSLLVAYEGFSPYELPIALSSLQCMDASQKRFYTDLFDTIEHILDKNSPASNFTAADGLFNVSSVETCHHIPTVIPARKPTFDHPGFTEGSFCSLCGKMLKPIYPIPAIGHAVKDGTVGASVISIPTETMSQGLKFRVNDDGETCTVEGQGDCQDKDIVIPNAIDGYPVTCVDTSKKDNYGSFISGFDKDITSVIISGSVISIGDGAFAECEGLVNAVIPSSVTRIGENAFYGCESLAAISIPDTVASIGNGAFSSCKSIKSIVIPDGITEIGNKTFRDCVSLEQIDLPDSVTVIGNGAFEYCKSLSDINIPNSVTNIGNDAFYSCESLSTLVIPSSLVSIGSYVFSRCSSLSTIQYNGSESQWKRINKDPYWKSGSSVRTVNFDSRKSTSKRRSDGFAVGLKYKVNDDGFTCTVKGQGTCNDTTILIPTVIDGYRVTNIGTDQKDFFGNLISDFDKKVTAIIIPNTVTCIDDYAFSGCGMTDVTISDSVRSIGNGVFQWCENLTKAVIPDGIRSIGNGAFKNCSSLTSVTLPHLLTSVSEDLFSSCSSLSSLTVPDSVTSIGRGAYSNCTSLSDIVIPVSVESIGGDAFSGCMNLSAIQYEGTKKQWKRIRLSKDWKKFSSIKKIHCTDGDIKFLFG